jgi:hypothetical protein
MDNGAESADRRSRSSGTNKEAHCVLWIRMITASGPPSSHRPPPPTGNLSRFCRLAHYYLLSTLPLKPTWAQVLRMGEGEREKHKQSSESDIKGADLDRARMAVLGRSIVTCPDRQPSQLSCRSALRPAETCSDVVSWAKPPRRRTQRSSARPGQPCAGAPPRTPRQHSPVRDRDASTCKPCKSRQRLDSMATV